MGGVIIHIMLITSQESDSLGDVVSLVTLSSAEASLYRREGWREGKRKLAGDDGKGKGKNRLFLFPSFPERFLFDLRYLREHLRRREVW